MKRSLTLVTSLVVLIGVSHAQAQYADFTNLVQRLYRATDKNELDHLWRGLVDQGKIPLAEGDSVAFLYRGPARSVAWVGDFNGWGQSKTFQPKPSRIPNTDIWILRASVPGDARLDYKILLNGEELILDPVNPANQWSGVGGGSLNSELRMPGWAEDPVTTQRRTDAAHGHLEKDMVFNSEALGYQVTYSVYTPPVAPERLSRCPVIYVTDGYEYMHERMGNMPVILDNLIHAGKIEPVMAVFIDHRQPVNRAHNRRMQELAMNESFARFVTGELIPHIEGRWNMEGNIQRAVVGTAMGGLTATWMVVRYPELIAYAGIQSPAYWFRTEIYSLCEQSSARPERIFMSTGLVHDSEEGARRMRDIFERKQWAYQYMTVNQGHSWGNWRDLIDDMLIYLFPMAN